MPVSARSESPAPAGRGSPTTYRGTGPPTPRCGHAPCPASVWRTQIDEYDVPVTDIGTQYIEQLGRELGVDPKFAGWMRAGLRERTTG